MWNSLQHQKNGVITTNYQNNDNSGSSKKNSQTLQPVKQLGMTSTISLAGPHPEDIQKTQELHKALQHYMVFETEEELNHRTEILAKLNTLVKQWIKEISLAKNMPEAASQKLGGKIYTFGSYRLGVHHKGADIDALCVAPRNIERADYFTSFFKLLETQPEVTECRSIEEAFVPVIKMNFDGIKIDLLFARLALKEIPDDLDLRDDKLLNKLDPWSIRSLNICRVTDEILSLVPHVENFRLALRCINLWAKKHDIYSNSLGYFGGVTWAILVARTCQLYPNATVSTLVYKFFLVFSHWKWPNPVLLKRPDNVNLNLPVWDPRVNASGRYHLMPVITPVNLQKNSTFNVSESSKKVILTEFNRGMTTVDEIMLGKASWNRLFEAPSFFYRYRYFIVLLVNSQAADDHLEWCSVVESKIRLLVGNLERNQHISLAHVNPKCFDHKKGGNDNILYSPNCSGNDDEKFQNAATGQSTLSSSPYCSMWFIGLEFERTEHLNVDLTESVQDFTELVIQHGFDIEMLKEGMTVEARHVKRQLLSQYLGADFMKLERKSMDNHNSSNNAIPTKRKRLSSEMQQKDAGSSDSSGKRPRVSESMEENLNESLRYYHTTTSTLQQQTSPTFNTAANKPQVDDASDKSNAGAGGSAALKKRKQKGLKIFQNFLLTQQNFSQKDTSKKIANVSKIFTKKLVNSAKDVLTLSRLQMKRILAKINKTSCTT